MRVAAICAAAGSLLLVARCGGGHNGPASYLDNAPNGAVLVQWTRSGSNLIGTLSEAYIDASDTFQLQHSNGSFHGVVDGSSLTLTFDQGFGTSTNWNGTLHGKNLTLTYTADDGTVKTLQFAPGTIGEYNAAVATTRQRVNAARQQKAAADAATQEQAQTQESQQAVDSDAASIASDITTLGEDASQPAGDLQSAAGDLKSMRGDVRTAATDLATTRSANHLDVCSDADTVSSDANTVQSDQNTLMSDQNTLTSDFQSISGSIQQLQGDYGKLKQDMLSVPGYAPSPLPSAGQVATAVASARQAMRDATKAMNGYLSGGEGLVAQANSYAASAQQLCSSSG